MTQAGLNEEPAVWQTSAIQSLHSLRTDLLAICLYAFKAASCAGLAFRLEPLPLSLSDLSAMCISTKLKVPIWLQDTAFAYPGGRTPWPDTTRSDLTSIQPPSAAHVHCLHRLVLSDELHIQTSDGLFEPQPSKRECHTFHDSLY